MNALSEGIGLNDAALERQSAQGEDLYEPR